MKLAVVLGVAVCAFAAIASGASARYQVNSVVPVFCSSDTIPAGSELKLRMRWVVRNTGQADKFRSSQKLTWTVTGADGTVLATNQPLNPEYGDTRLWSPKVHSNTTDINGDGVIDDVWYTDYLSATGVVVGLNQSVTVSYVLTANSKTDDGFGYKFNAYDTIASGTSCTVTGV